MRGDPINRHTLPLASVLLVLLILALGRSHLRFALGSPNSSNLGERHLRALLGKPPAGSASWQNLHTERHRELRELLVVAQRRAADLTQTVLTARLGKPPSFVAKYELGERRLDVREFLDIAAAIGFDPGENALG